MKKRFVTISACIVVLVAFCFSSAFSSYALTDPIVTDGTGWVSLDKISGISVFGSNNDPNSGGQVSFVNRSLPYTELVDITPALSYLWFETDLSYVNESGTGNSRFFMLPNGSNVSLRFFGHWGYYYSDYESSASIKCFAKVRFKGSDYSTTIDLTDYFVNATAYPDYQVGDFALVWDWQNDSGVDCDLLSLTFGIPQDEGRVPVGVSTVKWSCYSIKYRILTNEGLLIDGLGNEIKKQTETLTHGWSPSPVVPDGSGSIDDFDSAESALIDSANSGLNSGVSYLRGLPSIFSRYTNAFGFVRGIWFQMLLPGWVNDLLVVSLSLGFLGVLFGLVPTLAGRSSSRSDFKSDRNKNSNKKE